MTLSEERTVFLIYRCRTCGKWSHAKRKPKHHQRFLSGDNHPPSEYIEHIPAIYDHMNGFTSEGGWRVWCGPFDTYEADLIEEGLA